MEHEDFVAAYRAKAPWDIGGPQAAIVEVADEVRGAVIDLGCGTGEHALLFAGRGQPALGCDYVPEAIAIARAKAERRGLAASFQVMDALDLAGLPQQHDSGIDSGLFHTFADEDRPRYLRSLEHAIRPGGRLFLLCFSDMVPGHGNPRRIRQDEIRATFSGGWQVERVDLSHIQIAPGFDFSLAGAQVPAWRAVIRRNAE